MRPQMLATKRLYNATASTVSSQDTKLEAKLTRVLTAFPPIRFAACVQTLPSFKAANTQGSMAVGRFRRRDTTQRWQGRFVSPLPPLPVT